MNPIYYIACDPGARVSGLVTFNEEGDLTGVHRVLRGMPGIIEWFGKNVSPYIPSTDDPVDAIPRVIICENYRIKINHNLSTVPTIRVIGCIQTFAYMYGAEFVEQESTVYRTGIKWAGQPIPKGHIPDELSALGHGVYYLHKVAKKWKIKL
jgi:hypothetical protein